jgi:hypothetical protein
LMPVLIHRAGDLAGVAGTMGAISSRRSTCTR